MSLSATDYKSQLQALLPQGPAWPRDDSTQLARFLAGLAEEFARVDARTDALLDEADPRTTTELILEWERVCGLPDGCVGPIDGTAARRIAIVGRLTSQGGQSIAYFLSVITALGFAATITEETVHTCVSTCVIPINDQQWRFVWNVNVPLLNTVVYATCIDDCTAPLASWANAILECAINRLKPAHTLALFKYGP